MEPPLGSISPIPQRTEPGTGTPTEAGSSFQTAEDGSIRFIQVPWASPGFLYSVASPKFGSDEVEHKNNAKLTAAELKQHAREVEFAMETELRNYSVYGAIEAHERSGMEWNVVEGIWVLTWKYTPDGWSINARLVLRGYQDRQGATVLKYAPTASRATQRMVVSQAAPSLMVSTRRFLAGSPSSRRGRKMAATGRYDASLSATEATGVKAPGGWLRKPLALEVAQSSLRVGRRPVAVEGGADPSAD